MRLKPLRWREARCSAQRERFTAETILGSYEALEWSNGTFGGSVPALNKYSRNTEFTTATLDEAKAFCWAHYEGRVMQAFDA